jgi:uncharacterized radical SAM superfamily Fe-S cluster-containing enzyme
MSTGALVGIGGKKKRALGSVRRPLDDAKAFLADLDEDGARGAFKLSVQQRALKTTVSLCPQCLAHVPAVVFVDGVRVFGRKLCAVHGLSTSVFENDVGYYRLSSRDSSGRIFDASVVDDHGGAVDGCCVDGACGPGSTTGQDDNVTCTLLFEITNACNLSCKVCYADARGDRIVPVDDVKGAVRRILEERGRIDSLQVTGGEAALHPSFWDIVTFLHDEPRIKKVYLPTNGLLLSSDDAMRRLRALREKLLVLLQFDSFDGDANRALRDADPRGARARLLDRLAENDIFAQLTMTITKGVNDDEVGAVVDFGLRYDNVKVIALQPATYSGRYDLAPDPLERTTLSDVVKAVVAQAHGARRRGKLDDQSFVPIPCSHPNCGWITLFFRRFGIVENLTPHIDLETQRPRVTNRALLSTEELRAVVGSQAPSLLEKLKVTIGKRFVRSKDIFTVAVKPFMDRFTYDQDRVTTCCHHLLDTRGTLTSFCEYNALLRTSDSWQRFPLLDPPSTG